MNQDELRDQWQHERADQWQDRISEQWMNIGDKMRHRWHKLTRDDVLYANGSTEYLAGVLQDRYGVDRREALLQVFEFECDL